MQHKKDARIQAELEFNYILCIHFFRMTYRHKMKECVKRTTQKGRLSLTVAVV